MTKQYHKNVVKGEELNEGPKDILNIRGSKSPGAYPVQKKLPDQTRGANGGGAWRKK